MASFLIVFLAMFAPDPFREVVEDIAERPATRSPGAVELGISLGCPLSPPMAAFFLQELDERFVRRGLAYVRFMDEVLVLAPARWKLRQVVRAVNEVPVSLRLQKHPDMTFIGRMSCARHSLLTLLTNPPKRYTRKLRHLFLPRRQVFYIEFRKMVMTACPCHYLHKLN